MCVCVCVCVCVCARARVVLCAVCVRVRMREFVLTVLGSLLCNGLCSPFCRNGTYKSTLLLLSLKRKMKLKK